MPLRNEKCDNSFQASDTSDTFLCFPRIGVARKKQTKEKEGKARTFFPKYVNE